MQRYSDFQPTGFDTKGLGLNDQQDWLVCPVSRNRDSGILAESNWAVFGRILDELDPEHNDHETHRFGHWANGWFELVIVRPGSSCATEAESIEGALSDYPVLDEDDFSERETEAAQQVWSRWFKGDRGRLDYIKEHRSDFEFYDWAGLIACVRGREFRGCCSEIVE